MALSKFGLLNVPVPELLHVDELAFPPIEPDSVYVLPAQILADGPELAVAAGLTVTT